MQVIEDKIYNKVKKCGRGAVFSSNIACGRYNNVSEVIRAGLRRLEEDELRLAAIRAALIEGEESGIVEDFNPENFLQKLNADYESEV